MRWALNSAILAVCTTLFSLTISTLGGLRHVPLPVQGPRRAGVRDPVHPDAARLAFDPAAVHHHDEPGPFEFSDRADSGLHHVRGAVLHLDDEGLLRHDSAFAGRGGIGGRRQPADGVFQGGAAADAGRVWPRRASSPSSPAGTNTFLPASSRSPTTGGRCRWASPAFPASTPPTGPR